MRCFILTNNYNLSDIDCKKVFLEGTAMDVLLKARDYVHRGHRLISSPIGASVRMLMSPVKSILISSDIGRLDEESLLVIEQAIEKQKEINYKRGEDISNKEDYILVDKDLISAAYIEASTLEGGKHCETGTRYYQD